MIKFIKNYFIIKKFKKHNKKVFNQDVYDEKSIILIEFNAFQTSHIALSYVSNFLKKKYKANVHAYYSYSIIVSKLKESLTIKIKWFLSNFFSLKNIDIYKSFGVKKIFKPKISKETQFKAQKESREVFCNLKSKEDLLSIHYKDVLIGDLIYDTYLKSLKKYTLDTKDPKLENMIYEFYCLCYYWDDFFEKKDVKTLLCIHTVYSYAIPIRLAISKNISVYAMNMERLFYLSKKNYLKGTDFRFYPEQFNSLSKKDQDEGKKLAKQKLLDRFEGKTSTDIDLTYLMISSYSKKISEKNVLDKSKNIKILIAPHDFMDSIHVMGNLLFSDFYEWLVYLGKISEKTNYDWYIKNRPEYPGKFKIYQPITNSILEKIVKDFPNLKLLDRNISHHQLIKEGINFVFTGYGSIGLEYPFFGIPVINACENNPHNRYNFNISPKTIKEYEQTILNLSQISTKIDKEEIYEFYFMRHIYHNRKWLTRKHKEMVKEVGGYNKQFSSKLYNYWVNNYSIEEHKKTEQYINKFIESEDFILSIKHQNI